MIYDVAYGLIVLNFVYSVLIYFMAVIQSETEPTCVYFLTFSFLFPPSFTIFSCPILLFSILFLVFKGVLNGSSNSLICPNQQFEKHCICGPQGELLWPTGLFAPVLPGYYIFNFASF